MDFEITKSLGILFILINAKVIRSLELLKSRKVSKNCAKIEFFTENVKKLDDVELRFSTPPYLNHFNVKLQSVNFDYFQVFIKCEVFSFHFK